MAKRVPYERREGKLAPCLCAQAFSLQAQERSCTEWMGVYLITMIEPDEGVGTSCHTTVPTTPVAFGPLVLIPPHTMTAGSREPVHPSVRR